MKKTLTVLSIVALALAFATPVRAETDPHARKWIEALKKGQQGKYQGVDGTFEQVRAKKMVIPVELGNSGTNAANTDLDEDFMVCRQTVLTVDDLAVPITYGGAGTNSSGGVKLFDFPEGRILVHGVTVKDVVFTVATATNGLAGTDGGDFALGTVIGSGADLTSTEADLCPKTSIDPITNSVSAALAASAQFDGTSTSKDLYFNMLVDANDISADMTNDELTVDCTVTVTWSNLGDY